MSTKRACVDLCQSVSIFCQYLYTQPVFVVSRVPTPLAGGFKLLLVRSVRYWNATISKDFQTITGTMVSHICLLQIVCGLVLSYLDLLQVFMISSDYQGGHNDKSRLERQHERQDFTRGSIEISQYPNTQWSSSERRLCKHSDFRVSVLEWIIVFKKI